MAQLYALGAAEAARLIAEGSLSPVALVRSLLARAEALEPRLRAWVTLDGEALLEAARVSEEQVQRGERLGPLHGVPVGLKDIFYTKGVRTTAGSPIYANFVPDWDAEAVRRLKAAGALVMGKTVTTEFATFDPAPTRNPWNEAHTPGGSSSGSAAAVAARTCPAALGSQTAGSTIRPSAYCGVVGLVPTYGRVSRRGMIPVSWSLDQVGILVRTVEDAGLLLSALAGYDPEDPGSADRPTGDYARAARGGMPPPRLGLMREYFLEGAEPEVRACTEGACARLAGAGARLEEVSLPGVFGAVHAAHSVLLRVEAAAYHEELFRERREEYRPKLRSLIEAGFLVPGIHYLRAQRIRAAFRREICERLEGLDALVAPAAPAPAPRGLESTGDPRFNAPWTFASLPTMTLPAGLSEGGLPIGLQLVGSPFEEARLLAVARWCEEALGVELAPPLEETRAAPMEG